MYRPAASAASSDGLIGRDVVRDWSRRGVREQPYPEGTWGVAGMPDVQ